MRAISVPGIRLVLLDERYSPRRSAARQWGAAREVSSGRCSRMRAPPSTETGRRDVEVWLE